MQPLDHLQDRQRVLAVGIGSPHADDQIGWVVVRQLAMLLPHRVNAVTIQQPLALLDWIQGNERVIICDACQSGSPPGRLWRWNWPTDQIAVCARAGSHEMTLPFVLQLAMRLNKLANPITVWGIELGELTPQGALSSAVCQSLPKIVQTVADDLLESRSRREPYRDA